MPENEVVTPIMPTGSGVADLEVARELAALASSELADPEQPPTDDAADGPQAETEAHPS